MIRRWENCYRAQWGNVLVQQYDQGWWHAGGPIARTGGNVT
jgi:hypothetical protein